MIGLFRAIRRFWMGIPGWIPTHITNQGIHMKPHATCHLTLGRKAVCPWFTTVSHDWTSTHCKNAMVFRTLGEDGWSLQELLLVQDIGTRWNLGPSSCRIHHEESRRWCHKWLGTLRRLSLAFCEEDLLCVRSFQFLSNKLIKNSIFFLEQALLRNPIWAVFKPPGWLFNGVRLSNKFGIIITH